MKGAAHHAETEPQEANNKHTPENSNTQQLEGKKQNRPLSHKSQAATNSTHRQINDSASKIQGPNTIHKKDIPESYDG
jgi:hypothetical protein